MVLVVRGSAKTNYHDITKTVKHECGSQSGNAVQSTVKAFEIIAN